MLAYLGIFSLYIQRVLPDNTWRSWISKAVKSTVKSSNITVTCIKLRQQLFAFFFGAVPLQMLSYSGLSYRVDVVNWYCRTPVGIQQHYFEINKPKHAFRLRRLSSVLI
jgi:hypothetical protein